MDLQDLKRWHWIVISLVVGGALAYARSMISPDESHNLTGIAPRDFYTNIDRAKTGNGYAWIKDVTIYPAQTIEEATSGQARTLNFVTCSMLMPASNGKYQYKPVEFHAEVPFRTGNATPPRTDYSIRDYLDELKQQNSEISYRYAWWAKPRTQTAIWMGGSLLLIGGIWPTLINLMIGAGLGRPKKEQDDYDLDRFGRIPEPETDQPAKRTPSEAEMDRLRQMEAAMEKDLAGAGMQMTAGAQSAGSSTATGKVRQLTGGPVESTTATTPSGEPKEYGGEYYPVARPVVHRDDSKNK